MTRYQVTAHLVTVKVSEAAPYGQAYVYRGALLPDNALPDSVEHLLSLGMIRPVHELEEIR